MQYSHKIVLHYPDGSTYTIKLDPRMGILADSNIDFICRLHKTELIHYYSPTGAVIVYRKSSPIGSRSRKPLRTTNPTSKTKMQKKAEMMAKAKEAEAWGMALTNNLLAEVTKEALKEAEKTKYSFWLGETTI